MQAVVKTEASSQDVFVNESVLNRVKFAHSVAGEEKEEAGKHGRIDKVTVFNAMERARLKTIIGDSLSGNFRTNMQCAEALCPNLAVKGFEKVKNKSQSCALAAKLGVG